MNMLADGAAWLDDQRRTHLTTLVTYRRGATELVVPATIGMTTFEQQDSDGIVTRFQSRDFIITAADIADLGEPVVGDEIDEVHSGTQYTNEVMAVAGGPAWRWADAYREAIRVHTKQTRQVSAAP